MVDTSTVDIRVFYEPYVAISGRKPTRVWGTEEEEYEWHGSCPWCGGTDHFMFREPGGRYSCKIRSSGCGRHGRDVIDFLREYEGMSFFEACDHLGLDPGSEYTPSATREYESEQGGPPSKVWQSRGEIVIHKAQGMLWSSVGTHALDYLRKRGLTDETIRNAQLGYIPLKKDGRWFKDPLDAWGMLQDEHTDENGVWLPEGILIPYIIENTLWKLSIRRLTGLKDNDARYIPIAGAGSGSPIYGIDAIQSDLPAVVCEGPLDALAGQQACEGAAVFVATGSTTGGRRARWMQRLKTASIILIAYDDDPLKNGKRAGDEGADYWREQIPHAVPWLPWAHDINDMLIQGRDLRQWLELGKEVATACLHPGKRIVRGEDGIPIYIGYSDAEMRKIWQAEAMRARQQERQTASRNAWETYKR